MKILMTCLLTVVVGVLSFSSISTTTVFACSGLPGPTIEMVLEQPDIVVSGQFIELDDDKYNGIFEVNEYLLGDGGSKYLLLAVTPRWKYVNSRKQYRNLD